MRHPKKITGHTLAAASSDEKYALVETLSGTHPVNLLCQLMKTSRSGYYRHRQDKPTVRQRQRQSLSQAIEPIFEASRRSYGHRRVSVVLARQGLKANRKTVAKLMREKGLCPRAKKRFVPRTTDSSHRLPVAPNRLPETLATAPNQIWTTDITYVRTDEGWLYLAGVLDLFSRRVVGWACGAGLETDLVRRALRQAIQRRKPPQGLIHHSDRGCQYASEAYRQDLSHHGLVASMSRRGNCYDNAAMESFWSTLKHELVHREDFATREEARQAIFGYIEGFYNTTRLHSSLGYQSPLDFESQLN